MKRIILAYAFAMGTLMPLAAAAQTGSFTRTFVSAAGLDSNPCTIAQPCATFARAYTQVQANGIIAALDPGKYGPLTIVGPIAINGNGWAAITAPAAGNGITINAGASDKVALSGLNIDGAAAGYNGIVLNTAGSLTVSDCVLQNFAQHLGNSTTGNGLLVAPNGGLLNLTVTNTTAANNAFAGIAYIAPNGTTDSDSPTTKGVIDHVVTDANLYGIYVNSLNTPGGSIVATVSNSIASNNNTAGIFANGSSSAITLSIDNVSVSGNITGISGNGTAKLLLGRSVITGNITGVANNTASTFYTYHDSRINLNSTTDISSPLTTFTAQ